MKTRILVAALLAAVWAAGHAGIYRCLGAHGEPVFTDHHCGGPAAPVQLGTPDIDADMVSLSETRRRLENLRALPEPEAPRSVRESGGPLGFAERAELRQLEIRADGLRRDLARAARGRASREAMRRELAEAARRIRELRRRAGRS